MICFYHGSDLDGHCSAAIIKKKFKNVMMVPLTHGKKMPSINISLNDVVWMLDFTLEPFFNMIKLKIDCSELIWIDHHSSSIESSKKFDFNPPGIRDVSKAACELTWLWCYPEVPVPRAVKLISLYDTWNHNCKDVLSFQYGMRAKYTLPDSQIWNVLFDDYMDVVNNIISSGKNILEYVNNENKKYINAFCFETMFETYSCICCNRGMIDSRIFDNVWDEKRYDLMITFCRADEKWAVHIYTTHSGINCGKIANKYGGGGHKNAAAFRVKELPFNI